MTHALIKAGDHLASLAHGSIAQVRRYSGLPYIVHPRAALSRYAAVVGDVDPEVGAALLCHDVLEDTPVTLDIIIERLGRKVGLLVDEVTDDAALCSGSRATRKRFHAERRAVISAEAQTMSVVDLLDNVEDVVRYDPTFARVYLPEKLYLVDRLTRADPRLLALAYTAIESGLRDLAGV